MQLNVVAHVDGPAQQRLDFALGLLRARVRVGIDIAAAVALLRRDLPHPSRVKRVGERDGRDLLALFDVEPKRHRPVDGERVGVRQKFRAHRLADQAAAEAGGVDEKIALERLAVVEDELRDVAARRVALDAGDRRVEQGDAFGLSFEKTPDQGLIEMIGVMERPGRDQRSVGLLGERRFVLRHQMPEQVHVLQRAARRARIDVEIFARASVGRAKHLMRIVDRSVVMRPLAAPVLVADAEFDRGFRLAQKGHLVDAEIFEQHPEHGGRALADADGRDL